MDYFFNFWQRKTPEDLMRDYRLSLRKATRAIEQDLARMRAQEDTTVAETKDLVKKGQLRAAKIMARDVVRTRGYIQKFYKMRADLQAVDARIVTMQGTAAMGTAMRGAVKVMQAMNAEVKAPQLRGVLMEFQKQSDIMDAREDMMSGASRSRWHGDDEDDEEEEETDEVYDQVLEEVGLGVGTSMANAPDTSPSPASRSRGRSERSTRSEVPAGAAASSRVHRTADDDEFEARMDKLRKK
jgi:charged multivesicular body protein 2A